MLLNIKDLRKFEIHEGRALEAASIDHTKNGTEIKCQGELRSSSKTGEDRVRIEKGRSVNRNKSVDSIPLAVEEEPRGTGIF